MTEARSEERQLVLIVDDEPLNVRLLNEILREDYDIRFATRGKQALEVAEEQAPDLILLDVVMPEMDGYEVCRQLKADPATADVPVIFLSSLHRDDDVIRGLDLGAVDYIGKPFNAQIVRLRVRLHMELKRARDVLADLSQTDGLTGIANRMRFDDVLDREWVRASRSGQPLSLVLVDIDHFKLFNDHYGHLAGDDCLRQVARSLASCIERPTDLVARYGGEEMACVLPDTPAAGALRVAERLLAAVRDLAIPHARSGAGDHVTISLGVATAIPTADTTHRELVSAADEALYRAKEAGRDRIEAAGRVGCPVESET